eukprot:SAG11_NODE_2997_length_2781_cov_2.921700_5_plen_122_part_00
MSKDEFIEVLDAKYAKVRARRRPPARRVRAVSPLVLACVWPSLDELRWRPLTLSGLCVGVNTAAVTRLRLLSADICGAKDAMRTAKWVQFLSRAPPASTAATATAAARRGRPTLYTAGSAA